MEKSPVLNLDDVEYTNWGIGGAFEAKLGAVANRLGAKKLGYRVVALPPGAAPSQSAFWLVARKDAAVDYWEGES